MGIRVLEAGNQVTSSPRVKVDPFREVEGIMKAHKEVEDRSFQMQEYMKHNVDFQRRLISVRESRALLEKTHRMRKEKVSHMGFQFKQILWQMRRAQDDAYVTQERYLKLLQLEGGRHALRFTRGNARVEDGQFNSMHVNRVTQQSDSQANQDASHHKEHQNTTGNSQEQSTCESAPTGLSNDKDSPCAPRKYSAEDLEDLDSIQGTSFRFPSAIEENHDSSLKKNCDAQETQSYLSSANGNIEAPREERLPNIPQNKQRGEYEPETPTKSSNVCERDDFVSTSLFVCGNLDAHDSHELFLEQRKKAANLLDGDNKVEEDPPVVLKEKQNQGQGLSCVQETTHDGNKNSELDLPVSIMPITPRMTASTPRDPSWKEEEAVQEDAENNRSEAVKKPFLKIEKNDLLSQKIAKELEDFTKSSSLGCHLSKPITTMGAGNAWFNKVERTCDAEGTAEKNSETARGDTVKSKTAQGHVDSSGLTTEEKRKIMKEWYPHEKLGVLTTITNTMFLWKVEHCSSQEQNYGNWPECETLVSAAHAAKGGQRELFEFIETVGEKNMSRPMICCGAVCELLKACPPENLLPFRFIEDFFAYASKGANDQSKSVRPIEGLTFDHLEVYQDEEHTRFWQMLVHHVVSVKDHNLASFRQIAPVFAEILLPCTRIEDYPVQKAKDLQQDLLQFLVKGFRSKALHLFHVHYEDDHEHAPAQKRFQTVSKDLEGKSGFLTKHTAESHNQFQKAAFFTGLRSRRSSNLRRVSPRNGILSCFGSNLKIVRTNFRLWRLKALSRGVETVDEAVVSLLRKCREQEAH